jgi:hypothetical protein
MEWPDYGPAEAASAMRGVAGRTASVDSGARQSSAANTSIDGTI